jgi:uncharacterized protein YqgC (DUF456 family)
LPTEVVYSDWIYYLVGIVLLVVNVASWVGTLFVLPGNWLIVLSMALSAWFLPEKPSGLGVSWGTVITLGVMAIVGEVVEFWTGASKAKKAGASRRAMAMSLAGTAIGSLFGALITVPIPFVGSIVGVIGGAALGAYLGAYLGESSKGTDPAMRRVIGKAAMVGRMLGTVGKLIIGLIMVAFATVNSFA